jgi:hypothetical protein
LLKLNGFSPQLIIAKAFILFKVFVYFTYYRRQGFNILLGFIAENLRDAFYNRVNHPGVLFLVLFYISGQK